MNTKHIKRLELINSTWVIELWNSQIITNKNLALAIESIGELTYPQPMMALGHGTLAPELEAAWYLKVITKDIGNNGFYIMIIRVFILKTLKPCFYGSERNNMYLLVVNGNSIIDKPMTLQEIKDTFGSILSLEIAGILLKKVS